MLGLQRRVLLQDALRSLAGRCGRPSANGDGKLDYRTLSSVDVRISRLTPPTIR